MSTSKFISKFEFDGQRYTTDIPSTGDIKDGFWVDRCLEFTKASNNTYWIPSSQIYYVEKFVFSRG